ncbi:PD-(D/E)XK nuclease superfamily protein [Anabaena sp. WFMT]|uniref:PD-(D/E)XK nuclease superfamily protein n=1 Tax=Anabaena sp. WFMT TaxID=3449730 RepID=UPI003F2634A1
MTQGGKANKAGKILERTVEGTLAGHGYIEVSHQKQKQRHELLLNSTSSPKRYARQVYIGLGIYSTNIYVDFYIIGSVANSSGLIIECKWQNSSGSVDEKLPYVNLNIQNSYPVPAIVLIDGGGMKPGAINWLTTQVNTNKNLLGVYDLSSFIAWSNTNL